jgi:hypothetical protein
MSNKSPGKDPEKARGEHGARSEVNWDGGEGRQPYENQEPDVEDDAGGRNAAGEGDRGELSGRNLEQLEQVKKKP